jgi:tRNA C32,U32 (ribose-2'-O)-methylase TrmJ
VLVRIPADRAYASLNLAMAVQVVAYELYVARTERAGRAAASAEPSRGAPLAAPREMERLYAHLAEVMEEVGFRDRTQSGTHLLGRIRRFLQRAELDENEANILRGFLTSIQKRRRRAGEPK